MINQYALIGLMKSKSTLILLAQSLLMIAVVLTARIDGLPPGETPITWNWIHSLAILWFFVGLYLALASYYRLRESFTIKPAPKPNAKLETAFPFNRSRNPMYVGLLIMSFAWAAFMGSIFSMFSTLLLVLVLNFKIRLEEKSLADIFGEPYREYQKKVPRFWGR